MTVGGGRPPRLEEYFETALRDWLQVAASSHKETPQLAALRELAFTMERATNDVWLSEFLTALQEADLRPAIIGLSESADANAVGDTDAAKDKAAKSLSVFNAHGNGAGAALASFELAYAQARSDEAAKCLTTIQDEISEFPARYRWLGLQFRIEEAGCVGKLNELGKAQSIFASLLRQPDLEHFPVLKLRVLGFAASVEAGIGNFQQAWEMNLAGLDAYWKGTFPAARAYQFCDNLSYGPESAGLNYLVLVIARECVAFIALTENRVYEAMARSQLGQAALRVGERQEAKVELAKADAIFEQLPHTKDTSYYRSDGETSLALVEIAANQLNSAGHRLSALRSSVAESGNYTVKLRFHDAEGELALKRGDYQGAEEAFVSAALIGEQGLQQLKSDQDRSTWDHEARNAYRHLTSIALNDRHNPVMALELWEWFKAGTLRSSFTGKADDIKIVPSAIPTSIDQLVSSFPTDVRAEALRLHDSTVLTYAALPQEVVAWEFDDRGITFQVLSSDKQKLEMLAQRFREECADPNSDIQLLQRDAREIYAAIIQPFQERLEPSRTLIVESDVELAGIPIPALMDQSNRYFAESFRIVLSPAFLFSYLLPSQKPEFKKMNVLTVGLEEAQKKALAPLPDAPKEARIVATHFPHSVVLVDKQASRTKVLAALPSSDIFHFAGHAIETPSGVALLLHEDGLGNNLLVGNDLDRAAMPHGYLAVLSACETDGPFGKALSPKSLARSFLRVGVPHVLATSWAADSSETERFMSIFYSNLTTGMDIPTAVQGASTKIRSQPATSHPYFWAGFDVFGAP